MPAVYRDISEQAAYGLWHIREDNNEFSDTIPPDLQARHPKKKLEYLASRMLVRGLCAYMDIPCRGLRRDEHGKMLLMESAYHISISHAYPYAVVMIDKQKPCGIDIEAPRQQLLSIKHKFLNKRELAHAGENLELLCKYWCAKEALYKLQGRRRVIFSEHLDVYILDEHNIKGEIASAGGRKTHRLRCTHVDARLLVCSI